MPSIWLGCVAMAPCCSSISAFLRKRDCLALACSCTSFRYFYAELQGKYYADRILVCCSKSATIFDLDSDLNVVGCSSCIPPSSTRVKSTDNWATSIAIGNEDGKLYVSFYGVKVNTGNICLWCCK